jgi:hypothetical protein
MQELQLNPSGELQLNPSGELQLNPSGELQLNPSGELQFNPCRGLQLSPSGTCRFPELSRDARKTEPRRSGTWMSLTVTLSVTVRCHSRSRYHVMQNKKKTW